MDRRVSVGVTASINITVGFKKPFVRINQSVLAFIFIFKLNCNDCFFTVLMISLELVFIIN